MTRSVIYVTAIKIQSESKANTGGSMDWVSWLGYFACGNGFILALCIKNWWKHGLVTMVWQIN